LDRTLDRATPRLLQILNGSLSKPGSREVMGNQLELRFDDLGENLQRARQQIDCEVVGACSAL